MRVALGTAIVMGLAKGKMETPPSTAHFLIGEKCTQSCSYCNLKDSKIARIEWLEFPDDLILNSPFNNFKRACLQLTTDGLEKALKIIPKIPIPISVSIRVGNQSDFENLFSAGIDHVCIPIDACTAKISAEVGRPDFNETLKLLESLCIAHPGKVTTHLIIGLGETEKDAIELIRILHTMNVTIGLFAFTPVQGSQLESHRRPYIGSYRRIQVAKYLIEHNKHMNDFCYDKHGQIKGQVIENNKIQQLPGVPGKAFETSGCPDCNRPFFDSTGSHAYNSPRPLTENELKTALKQARAYERTSIYKAEKLLKICVEYSDAIESIKIMGDFFLYPEEAIFDLENSLIGCSLKKEEIHNNIKNALAKTDTFGFDADSLTNAIMEAIN